MSTIENSRPTGRDSIANRDMLDTNIVHPRNPPWASWCPPPHLSTPVSSAPGSTKHAGPISVHSNSTPGQGSQNVERRFSLHASRCCRSQKAADRTLFSSSSATARPLDIGVVQACTIMHRSCNAGFAEHEAQAAKLGGCIQPMHMSCKT